MSMHGSELHRFGIDPDSPPDQRQWENVCKLLKALLNNPNLIVGNSNSQIIFPEPIYPALGISSRGSEMPFPVKLITTTGGTPTYEVTVGWGYVIERIPGSGNAVAYHEAANMWDEVDATKLRKFPIEVGQAVYIKVHVNADGEIGQPPAVPPEVEGGEPTQEDAVAIVVAADNAESVHYQPKVDTDTSAGARGYYFYKLDVLKAAVSPSTQPRLEKWLSGSHLNHWQDLPAILSTLPVASGIGVIPEEWNNTAKAYRLRPVAKGAGNHTVTTFADYVEVRGTQKDGQIFIWYGDTVPTTAEITHADGHFTSGSTVIGDEEVPVDPQRFDIKIPEVVAWDDPDSQIQVSNIGVNGGTKYRVKGNGNNGTFSISVNGGSEVPLLTCKDGLVDSATTNIDIVVGGALPDGVTLGDMLYWGGAEWVLLETPGDPDTGYEWVLHISATGPEWIQYEKVTVNICVSGTPQEYTILGIATPPPP